MTRSRSEPDVVIARTKMGERELAMGIPPIESLLAERDQLVEKSARLAARHGSFGSWEAERKVELSRVAAMIRAQAVLENTKMTEAAISDAAHASDAYAKFIADSVTEKAEWVITQNRISSIGDTIRRGDVIGRYLAAEARL